MPDVTVKDLKDFERAFGGGMARVRAGLGVTSFGVQVIELPPGFSGYPEHDHSHDDQEELYTVLEGRVTLRVGDTEHELEPGTFARVGPGEKRKLITGEGSCRILAVGGTPGAAYEPPEFTEEGAGDMPKKKEEAQL